MQDKRNYSSKHLEDKIEMTLFVLVAIAALYFTDNSMHTGYAVLLNSGINITLGSVIWIALFVFTLTLIYLKVRRIRKGSKNNI